MQEAYCLNGKGVQSEDLRLIFASRRINAFATNAFMQPPTRPTNLQAIMGRVRRYKAIKGECQWAYLMVYSMPGCELIGCLQPVTHSPRNRPNTKLTSGMTNLLTSLRRNVSVNTMYCTISDMPVCREEEAASNGQAGAGDGGGPGPCHIERSQQCISHRSDQTGCCPKHRAHQAGREPEGVPEAPS